jgi:hypothetical protein
MEWCSGELDVCARHALCPRYAQDRAVSGPVFGSKDYFRGLAVFLDTYSNHNGVHAVRVKDGIELVFDFFL